METDKNFIAFEATVDVFNELPFVDIETVLGMLIVHYASDIACVFGKSKDDFVDTLFDKVIADIDEIDELKKANLAEGRCQKRAYRNDLKMISKMVSSKTTYNL